MAGVRCFAAIPVPACLLDPLLAACDAMREADTSWRSERWVARENIHITVKFFGTLPDGDVEPLARALAEQFDGHREFELPFSGVRAVPKARRASMLWAAFLDPEGAAAAIAEAADRAALPFGVLPEERSFKPHATLARARRPKRLQEEALQAAEQALSSAPASMSVHRVSFISSRLTPRGPVYQQIDGWELSGR